MDRAFGPAAFGSHQIATRYKTVVASIETQVNDDETWRWGSVVFPPDRLDRSVMSLWEDFAALWKHADSEESCQMLSSELKSYILENWAEGPEEVENLLLTLLAGADGFAAIHILTAILSLSHVDLKNESLIECIVGLLDHRSPDVRLAAIKVVGRMGSERSVTPGTFLSHLMRKLESEWDSRCRDRLLVYAETAIDTVRKELAKSCLGETADTKRGPWREILVLDSLGKLDVSWRDWSSFLDKFLPTAEVWDNLTWMAFHDLIEYAKPHSSLHREVVERLPELIRITTVIKEKRSKESNRRNVYVLTGLLALLSRRQKKEVLDEHVAFLVDAMEYDDPGISAHCLELFAELGAVPLISRPQRVNLLTHEDDVVRELAQELFDESPESQGR